MSDPLTAMLRQLHDQPPPKPFAPAEAVRRRGRQRTRRRTAAVTVLTSLAVIGAVLAVASVRPNRPPDPATTPHPSVVTTAPTPRPSTGQHSPAPSGPAPTAVASGLLLQPADLPPGNWTPARSELFEGPDLWPWANACPAYRSADYPSLRRQSDVGTVSYASGSRRLDEIVELYPPGWGARNLADVRKLVITCAGQPPSPGSRQTPAPTVLTVIDTGLAGEESLLIRVEGYYFNGETIAPTPHVTLAAVVRVGDLVATVLLPEWATPADAGTLATAGAARLAHR